MASLVQICQYVDCDTLLGIFVVGCRLKPGFFFHQHVINWISLSIGLT